MNKSVLITGVAGSGKSFICSELSKLGYLSFDIEELDGLFSYVNKKTKKPANDVGNQDLETIKQHDWLCDKKKLEKLIKANSKSKVLGNVVFYCGAGANTVELIAIFDKGILLVASEPVARRRLAIRTNKDFGKKKDVRDWVMSWKRWWEDQYVGKGAVVIDADQPAKKVIDSILKEL
jgi:hypothetical protein